MALNKSIKCPKCEGRSFYTRIRTQENVCKTCGFIGDFFDTYKKMREQEFKKTIQ